METIITGRWLIYSWTRFDTNRNDALIHPEDLAAAEQKGIGLSECIKEELGYLVLNCTWKGTIRAKPEGVRHFLPTPELRIGSQVREVERPEVQGTVCDLVWHYKELAYKYFLTVDGKKKSRRYDARELTRTED